MLFDGYIRIVHINIELKAESNKVISVLAQTQVYMASKAFWEGTAYLSGAPEFILVFSGIRVTRSLVLYVCFVGHCLSFCTFLLAIVLSVLLRYTDSDFPFGIFKLLLHMKIHRNQIINISVFFIPYRMVVCSIFSNYIYRPFHGSSCWWLDRWRRNQGSVNLHFYFH